MAKVLLAPVHTQLLKTWTLISKRTEPLSHTGNINVHTFDSFNVAAGGMGPNGMLRITSAWSFIGAAGNHYPIITFGGPNLFAPTLAGSITLVEAISVVVNRNNAAVNYGTSMSIRSNATSDASKVVLAVDTAIAVPVVFQGQLAVATDTISLEYYFAELYYAA